MELVGGQLPTASGKALASAAAKLRAARSGAAPTIDSSDLLLPSDAVLEAVNTAIVDRRLLEIEYWAEGTDKMSERTVEPYLLVHSRGEWYYVCWCRTAGGTRVFRVATTKTARLLDETFEPRPDVQLDLYRREGIPTSGSYAPKSATVWYSPVVRRWIAEREPLRPASGRRRPGQPALRRRALAHASPARLLGPGAPAGAARGGRGPARDGAADPRAVRVVIAASLPGILFKAVVYFWAAGPQLVICLWLGYAACRRRHGRMLDWLVGGFAAALLPVAGVVVMIVLCPARRARARAGERRRRSDRRARRTAGRRRRDAMSAAPWVFCGASRLDVPRADAFEPPARLAPAGDLDLAVERALADPVAAPRLRELARGAATVAVTIPDASRPCPSAVILTHILEELGHAGVPDAGISVHIGCGLHATTTPEERAEPRGERDGGARRGRRRARHRDRVRRPRHHAAGVPVHIARRLAEADLAISVGVVEPHLYAGFSGGVKGVAIGCAGRETIAATHHPRFISQPGVAVGELAGNPFQRDAAGDRRAHPAALGGERGDGRGRRSVGGRGRRPRERAGGAGGATTPPPGCGRSRRRST